MLDRARYFFEKAWGHFRQGLAGNLLAMATIGAALFVFLAYLLIQQNLSANLEQWRSRMSISVYLRDATAASEEKVADLRQMIEGLSGVAEVRYYTKKESLEQYRKDLKGQAGILDELPENPLPAYFVVTLKTDLQSPERVAEIAGQIRPWEEVEEVAYGEEWIGAVAGFIRLFRLGGLVLGGLLLLAILFIVFNTIRLALFARRDEIEIMQLVGATALFIKIPFLIEGAMQTLASCVVALALLYGIQSIYGMTSLEDLASGLGHFEWHFFPMTSVLAMILVSGLAGMAGSWIAVQRFLKS